MEIFKKININPNNRMTSDCIIRALSLFLNQDYYVTLNDLMTIYLNTGFHISDPVCFMIYLTKFKNIHKTESDYKQRLILKNMCIDVQNNEFDKLNNIDEKNSNKILVFLDNSHLTYLEKGVIIDSWDCSTMKVNAYYSYKY